MITASNENKPTSSTKSTGLFRTADGRNYAFTFLLVCSLFLLWGLCNGMIDILNKHFQNSLSISKTQSGFVQFSNYMGYFIMALPAGMLARRFGYKGGILVGLALIALGAFWFIPATRIGTYWAFLTGLFILATGLTCLETVANPYATVLGPPETGAARINLAQSTNGVGWILGPIVAGMFVLSSTGEVNRSNAELYKPYLLVGVIVTILLVIFMFSNVPDLTTEDESKVVSEGSKTSSKPLFQRWHFVLAVAAQFLYVAAQTGVFSYFVNYMASDAPVMADSMAKTLPPQMTAPASLFSASDVKDLATVVAKLQNDPDAKTRPVSQFLWTQISATNQALLTTAPVSPAMEALGVPRTSKDLAADLDQALLEQKRTVLLTALNQAIQTNSLYDAQRFAGLPVSQEVSQLLKANPQGEPLVRLNRGLLDMVFPANQVQPSVFLRQPAFRITDRGAALMLSFGGFVLFLIGRFTGSFALRFLKAHSTLALYAIINVVMMVLVIFPLGWLSVAGLFLSFFFMSIMFPTIFALGIHGLGDQTKKASSFIVMSIVGGAIMPLFMGWLADTWSMKVGFLMPLLCFLGVAAYAASWRALQSMDSKA